MDEDTAPPPREPKTLLPPIERAALIQLFNYRARTECAYYIDGHGPVASGERIVEALEDGRVLTAIPLEQHTRQS
jgi:hypothetical protein